MKLFFAGFITLQFVLASMLQPNAVLAQAEDPYSYELTQPEFDEYYAAINNCETPSLECLVRYTTRYVAIEWVNDITGTQKVGSAGAMNPDGTPYADSTGSGAIYGLFYGMGMMYSNPPANTQTYIADVVNSAGFAPPAYAQGLGFASLDPILNLWKAFRNIAYFFFILFFIVIGIMIMFRFKIGGQAAITAQQAIPSVIISLLLVTFSYAIAGFMIDLMYVSMYLMIGLFSTSLANSGIGAANSSQIIDMNILGIMGMLFGGIFASGTDWFTDNAINSILSHVIDRGSTMGNFGNIAAGLTLSLIIAIALLVGTVRLFFELLKSYFTVIATVVTAPLILMAGAIPGQNVFWPWLKNIIGNLAAFPTVLLVIILFSEFVNPSGEPVSGGFIPPFLFGSGVGGMIGPILGLATILALPEIVKKTKEAAGAKDGWFSSTVIAGADRAFTDGLRKTPIATGIVGGALGSVGGAFVGVKNQPRSWSSTFQGMGSGWAEGFGRGYRPAQWVARQYEQAREGRTLDPNSWENAMLRLEKSLRDKQPHKTADDTTPSSSGPGGPTGTGG